MRLDMHIIVLNVSFFKIIMVVPHGSNLLCIHTV